MPQSPPPRRDHSHRARQSRGLLLASVAGVAGVGVLGWFFIFGGSAQVVVVPQGPGVVQAPKSGDPETGLLSGTDLHLDIMDKKEPTRQAGLLIFAKLDPLEAHHYAADKPQGYFYLKDGRTVYVRSDTGRLYMPTRAKEPESGTLLGHVVIRVFAARQDGARIDLNIDEPTATVRTDTLAFDGALGKVDTPDRVIVTTPELTFTGRGMRMIFNQVKQRLELLEFAQGEELRYTRATDRPDRPEHPRPAAPRKPVAQQPAAVPAPPPLIAAPAATQAAAPAHPSGPAPHVPVETLYSVVFNESVAATQDQKTIKSDKLQVWARLIDNKLPEGAISRLRSTSDKTAPPQGQTTPASIPGAPPPTGAQAAVPPPPSPPAGEMAGPPAPPPESTPLVLHWTGPCRVTPMETTPAELKSDHVALRFTADQSGLVTFEDGAHRATGHSAYVDYFATTRRMALVGPGPMSVSMTAPDEKGGLKRIDGVRLDPVINDDATIIHASGPSVLTSISAPDGSAATGHSFKVSSTDQADFTIENKNGNVTNALRQAIFQGNVQIEDTGGTLQGGYVRADFIATSDQPSVLSRLIVQDHAVANSAESGHLTADHLDVAFKPGEKGRNPDPTQLTAEGNVKLDKAGTSLSTDFLDAALARSAKGSVDVTAATARGSVHYADKTQNVSTDCDLLQADFSPDAAAPDGHRQIVDLSGPKTILRQADQTTITGTQMRLDGVGQRLEVFGPGEFDSHDAKRGSSGLTTIHATWTLGMTFDDLAGNVQCNGNVISDSTSDSLQRDHLEAERVTLSITPRRPASGTPDLDAGKKDKERKLLRAVALGSVLDREGGTNAHAESRTYVADEGAGAEGGQRLIQIYYVEGPRILADNEKGTLDVPVAGRMLTVDQRPTQERAPKATPAPGSPPDPENSRGNALFEWQGGMHMDRPRGVMHMLKAVQLTHQKLETRDVTIVNCEDLTARFREKSETPPQSAEPASPRGELISTTAVGSVYIASGPARTPSTPKPPTKEMASDRADYDALKRTVDAIATPGSGNMVKFFEPTRAVPTTASHIFWDMANDRIEIKDPGALVAPK